MTEQERDDELELIEARRARKGAERSLARAAEVAGRVNSAADGIRTIVDRNGYVERFREILRGA